MESRHSTCHKSCHKAGHKERQRQGVCAREIARPSSRQTLLNYAYFNFELIALINTLPGATSALTCQQHRRLNGFRNVCKGEEGREGERESKG